MTDYAGTREERRKRYWTWVHEYKKGHDVPMHVSGDDWADAVSWCLNELSILEDRLREKTVIKEQLEDRLREVFK